MFRRYKVMESYMSIEKLRSFLKKKITRNKHDFFYTCKLNNRYLIFDAFFKFTFHICKLSIKKKLIWLWCPTSALENALPYHRYDPSSIPVNHQRLYVIGYGSRPLGQVGFLRALGLSPTLMTSHVHPCQQKILL